MSPPRVFTFWESSAPPPAHIELCLESLNRNLAPGFEHHHLNFETAGVWVPERDALWDMSLPATEGRSASSEGRRWALFTGMLRVALLARHGGMWVDADTLVFPNFQLMADIVPKFDLVTAETANALPSNSFLGARTGSPVMAAYFQRILDNLQAKRDAGETRIRWGENGFRMLAQILRTADPEHCFVAPYGSLIGFNTAERSPLFDKCEAEESSLSCLSMALTIFNNALDDTARVQDRAALLSDDTLFSAAASHALGMDTHLDAHLVLRTADQLLSLNRAQTLIAQAAALSEKQDTIQSLREKLQARSQKIARLQARTRSNP